MKKLTNKLVLMEANICFVECDAWNDFDSKMSYYVLSEVLNSTR